MRYKLVDEAPKTISGGRFKLVQEETSEVPEQFTKSAVESLGGAYGSIADLLGMQTKERLLPGQQARAEMEAKATPEELINLASDSDILPDYARLPSAEEVRELTGRKEPKTASGRFAARAGSAVGSTLAMGGGLGAMGTSVAGSQAGQVMREAGAPESLAIGTDIATSLAAGTTPSLLAKKTPVTTAAGLPVRKFEKVTKPTKISSEAKSDIAGTVLKDLRDATEKIMEPNKVFKAMKEFPDFENRLSKSIDAVEAEAKTYANKIPAKDVVSRFEKIVESRRKDPFMNSEQDKAYMHYAKQQIKELSKSDKELSIHDLYSKYRQTNADRRSSFEVAKSKAKNEAKKEALGDVNRAIAETFEAELPNENFPKVFKFTNKMYEHKSNINQINKFLDSLGSKGINFNKASKYFGDERLKRAMRNTFGEEAEKQFSGLMNDFLTKKDAYKLLGRTEEKSLKIVDLAKAGILHMISPELAGYYASSRGLLELKKYLYQQVLKKPQYIKDWKKGLDLIKKGQASEGVRVLKDLKEELEEE